MIRADGQQPGQPIALKLCAGVHEIALTCDNTRLVGWYHTKVCANRLEFDMGLAVRSSRCD